MNIVKHELQKVLTTPGWLIIAGLMVLVTFGLPLISSINVLGSSADTGTVDTLGRDYLFSIAGRSAYFAPFLAGALIVTSDFAHSTVWMSVLWFRSRLSLSVAKLVTAMILSAFLGLIAVIANYSAVTIGFISNDLSSPALSADMLAMAARTIIAFVLWGAIGVGLGLLVRSQIAAMAIVFGIALIIEPMLTSLANENSSFATIGRFLPGPVNWSIVWPVSMTADTNAMGSLDGSALSLGAALVAMCAYAAVVFVGGYVLGFKNREA